MVSWTKEQLDAIETTGTNILVSAAAGSGKTAVLVERIIQQLTRKENPLHIDEILVATFTNAAAEEMRNRIGAALEKAIEKDPSSYHLKKQLSLLQRAHISTLHSFCTTVVRQYAYLLDIDPAFRIADEMEIDLLKQEVIEELFEQLYSEEGERLERFFKVVDMFASDRSDVAVEELILTLYTFAMQHPWPEKWLQRVAEAYNVTDEIDEREIEWLTLLKEEAKERFISYIEEIEKAIAITRTSDGPYHYEEALQADLTILYEALEKVDEWNELQEHVQSSKLKSLSRKKVDCDVEKRERVKKIRDRFRSDWNDMKKSWFGRSLHSHIEDMQQLYPVMQDVVTIVMQFKERFMAMKKERALVDFQDLEHFCLAILLADSSTETELKPSDVALSFQRQFKEILIDEYQDINVVQEFILSIVSDQTQKGNIFMVGDVKQSIYRFRHAEPTLFLEKYKLYATDQTAGYRIDLAKNFRSRKSVLDATNYIFRQILDETVGELTYDDAAQLVYGNRSYDDLPFTNAETELYVIDRDDSNSESEVENLVTAQLEARLYAQKIKDWIGTESNEPLQVVDKETNVQRDCTYRDIVILLRSLTDVATIVDELKKEGIPVHAELSTGYLEAIEIKVMLSLLKVIDNPFQDIPLASVLRSPIVGLHEDDLSQIRLSDRRGTFFEALQRYATENKRASERVQTFLTELAHFRELAKEGSLAALIWEIYRTTGYYDFVGGIPGGRQRQANLRALYDRARIYEQTSFRGLFRFLRFIERMEEQRKDLGEARALSEQEDVVRIMTIHKSKGLEFPLVILGGMGKEFNFRDLYSKYILDKDAGFATKFIDPVQRITYPTLFHIALQQYSLKKLLAEEMRVLYVAMTRAKEKLTLVASVKEATGELDDWAQFVDHKEWVLPNYVRSKAKSYIDWIGPALVRHKDNASLRESNPLLTDVREEITHDPSIWNVHVVSRNDLVTDRAFQTVSKNELEQAVTNWQPTPTRPTSRAEDVARILQFSYPYSEAATTRAKQSVTEIKRRREMVDEFSDQYVLHRFRDTAKRRPAFLQEKQQLTRAEIGTAMHTVMQHIPLDTEWPEKAVSEFVQQLVIEEKLTKEEAEVIDIRAIATFFTSDIAKKIKTARKVEREVPFTYMLHADEVYLNWESETDEKVLIQGVVDCLIETDDGLFILDYKTDKILDDQITEAMYATLRDRYKVQMDLYRKALEDVMQREVTATYLYFFDRHLLIAQQST